MGGGRHTDPPLNMRNSSVRHLKGVSPCVKRKDGWFKIELWQRNMLFVTFQVKAQWERHTDHNTNYENLQLSHNRTVTFTLEPIIFMKIETKIVT